MQIPGSNSSHLCPFHGTSQASPHVAGLAALAKQRLGHPPAQVVEYLLRNAASRPRSPDHIWGHGLAQLPDPSQPAGEEPDPTPGADAPAPTAVSAPGDVARSAQPCPAQGPSASLECDKQILLAIRDTLRGTNTAALSNWLGYLPVAECPDEYGNGKVLLDGTPRTLLV